MVTFTRNAIDNISQVNMDELTCENLRCHYGTGTVVTDHQSRREKNWRYRTGIQTNLGDIEISVWVELVRILIKKENGQEIFSQLMKWNAENYPSYYKDKEELEISSMKSYAMRLFDDKGWCDYIRFNKRFRPEILEDSSLLEVITDCCNKPCKVTREQFDEYSKPTKVPCPLCNKSSTFKIIG